MREATGTPADDLRVGSDPSTVGGEVHGEVHDDGSADEFAARGDRLTGGGEVRDDGSADDLGMHGDLAAGDGEVRDSLPADLDASGYVGPYLFPNNSRRRISGVLYLVIGAVSIVAAVALGADAVLINGGFAAGGAALMLLGAYCLLAGFDLAIDENDALVAAARAVGFPVGHASAQLAWRGLRSRPTWRLLIYSNEAPPSVRGLVIIDGVDGEVLGHMVEPNPEDWTDLDA